MFLSPGAISLAAVVVFSIEAGTFTPSQASETPPSRGTMPALFGGEKANQKSTLKQKQRKLARTLVSGLEKEAHLVFFSESGRCRECGKVKSLLEEITGMSPLLSLETLSLKVDTERAAELGIDKVPGIAILDGEGNDSGIRYFGTPLGFEFESFLEAVVNTAHGTPALQPETLAGLSLVEKPVTITIFVAQH